MLCNQVATMLEKCIQYFLPKVIVIKFCGGLFIKFTYSEKATKFCEISTLLLTKVHTVKSKVEISQNLVAFSEYMNFTVYYSDAASRWAGWVGFSPPGIWEFSYPYSN
mgnify:CR=1 FL=1